MQAPDTPDIPDAVELLDRLPALLAVARRSEVALGSLGSQLRCAEAMTLSPRMRRAIALRVAELHGCPDELPCPEASRSEAASFAEAVSGFDPGDCRRGRSDDPREQALLALVSKVVRDRGRHAGFVVDTARQLGVSDTEIVEAVSLASTYTLASYLRALADALGAEAPAAGAPAVPGDRRLAGAGGPETPP